MKTWSVIAAVLLTSSLSFADNASLLQQIQSSKSYKEYVAKNKKLARAFYCDSVLENLTSKDHSRLGGVESRFSLVVLSCASDYNDGGDPIHEAGLAVISDGDVLSFTTGSVAQPD